MDRLKNLIFGDRDKQVSSRHAPKEELPLNAELGLRLAQEGFLAITSELSKDGEVAAGLIGRDGSVYGPLVDSWQKRYQDNNSVLFVSAWPERFVPDRERHEGMLVSKLEIHTTASDGALTIAKYVYLQDRGVFKTTERFTKQLLTNIEEARRRSESFMKQWDAMMQKNEEEMMKEFGVSNKQDLLSKLHERFQFFQSLNEAPPEFKDAVDIPPPIEAREQIPEFDLNEGYSYEEPVFVDAEKLKGLNEYLRTFL